MTTFKKTLLALAATLPLLAISLPSQAAMTPYMEKALIDVCKAAKSNSVIKFKGTTKYYRLKTKTVALKLMCNGEDVITFAESYGADKTAARLQKSLGNVRITDVAALTKVQVTF
ncbi:MULTISPECIES: DUF3718 domain-containing protein [Colwellia]|jgi:hypothetical protein|uniref:DUF3718 domain-containing protein n=1 Tax=Colwellia psychrerythraea (strain 34H / ATCC BAA-681) TaxID=167879 RepID=Q47W73_COLP3|nr:MULTISPECIES: DUF3718 domain-containing protein [Colwellia]AAZ28277.1 hypothetical protein CPS_4299 [Colwellia psychrerythraea 34H]PKH85415.1 DUF3718 domain-containing protein [Colwellia sp. Bg11-28]